MLKNKKGTLEASETGDWTLFVIAAVILIIFVGVVYALLKGSSEDDLCKLSVLGRATAPISAAQEFVPLKCIVKKVCFSDGRGNCDDPLRGEKNVLQVKIPQPKNKDDADTISKAAKIIESESASRMYECWKMMGEGKLDLFNGVKESFGINPVRSTCVICSRLVVDKNIPSYVLEAVDVNEYMKSNSVSTGGGMTYLQAFTGSKDVKGYAKFNPAVFKIEGDKLNVDALKKHNGPLLDSNENTYDKEVIKNANLESDVTSKEANRELAFVFMQIKSKKATEVMGNMLKAGGLVVGSTFMTPIVKPASRLLTSIAFTPAGAISILGSTGVALGYGAYNAKQGQLASAGYCGKFTTNEQTAREGCSMVQGLNYNKDTINALCGSIQGRLYEG